MRISIVAAVAALMVATPASAATTLRGSFSGTISQGSFSKQGCNQPCPATNLAGKNFEFFISVANNPVGAEFPFGGDFGFSVGGVGGGSPVFGLYGAVLTRQGDLLSVEGPGLEASEPHYFRLVGQVAADRRSVEFTRGSVLFVDDVRSEEYAVAVFDFSFNEASGSVRIDGFDELPVGPVAVPEPATWAMMIGGFGLVGGAMRRRVRVRIAYA